MVRSIRSLVLLVLLTVVPVLCQTAPAPDVEARVSSLLKQLSLEEKIDLLGGVDGFYIRAIDHIGLPRIRMADGPIGVRNFGTATALAGGIGLAASWDPELAYKAGDVIGQDAQARGVHYMLCPGVNIFRGSLNGRNFEYFGEDPFLASRMAVGYIKGIQSHNVSATVKHFMGNNSEWDRHNSNSIIDERTMRELYLPAFEAAVKEAHVGSIMDSYNLVNGVHMTQNGYLNTDVAKKEWGFDGVMMSDWTSTYDAVGAANGGLDLEMPFGKYFNRTELLPAIQSGKVSEATIDDKVRRILRVAVRFGWLDRKQEDLSIPFLNPQGRQIALEAARGGAVLLKNDGNLLPLDKAKIKSIAVIGPDAYPAQPVGGGSAAVRPFAAVSYLEGISDYLKNGAKVYYHKGIPTLDEMARNTVFSTEASGGIRGLKVERFKSDDFSGEPADVRTAERITYFSTWHGFEGLSAEFLSTRWTGYYVVKNAGKYLVFLQGPSEEGKARVFLDDKLVLDNWESARAFLNYAAIGLEAGAHKVRIEFSHTPKQNPQIRVGIVDPATVVDPAAQEIASKADVVIVAAGFEPSSEGEGADRTFGLPPGQDELIQAMAAANKNTIVVLTSGGNVDMNAWVEDVPALIEAWYPGQEGGTAFAQLLFGDYSPSGKLPVSFEKQWKDNPVYDSYYANDGKLNVKYNEGIFVGYRHYDKADTKPRFPFGFGLSYTSFAYKNLAVSPVSADGVVTVSFDVSNTGKRAGAEVAQVYIGDGHAPVPRPVKELKGFSKVSLKPGETKRVSVTLDRRAFSYYDVKGKGWKAEPGDFNVLVGRSSAQIELTGKVTLKQ